MTQKAKGASTAKQAGDAFAKGQKTMEQAVKASTEGYEQAVEMTKGHVEKTSAAVMRGYDDYAAFSKNSVSAFVEAGNIWSKGFEDMGKMFFEFAQASSQQSVDAAKTVMSAKTITDVVDAQSAFAKSSFDKIVSESTKMSELTMSISNEAAAPVQAQLNEVAAKFVSPTA
ncbi:MAG: phasin family protein [Alphaproteobacteria bacterium]|nr:phasin family protein [Alphaproteobacteria bacterium]